MEGTAEPESGHLPWPWLPWPSEHSLPNCLPWRVVESQGLSELLRAGVLFPWAC